MWRGEGRYLSDPRVCQAAFADPLRCALCPTGKQLGCQSVAGAAHALQSRAMQGLHPTADLQRQRRCHRWRWPPDAARPEAARMNAAHAAALRPMGQALTALTALPAAALR